MFVLQRLHNIQWDYDIEIDEQRCIYGLHTLLFVCFDVQVYYIGWWIHAWDSSASGAWISTGYQCLSTTTYHVVAITLVLASYYFLINKQGPPYCSLWLVVISRCYLPAPINWNNGRHTSHPYLGLVVQSVWMVLCWVWCRRKSLNLYTAAIATNYIFL